MKREEKVAAIRARVSTAGMIDLSEADIFVQGNWNGTEFNKNKVFFITPMGVADCPEEDYESIDDFPRDYLENLDDETINAMFDYIFEGEI